MDESAEARERMVAEQIVSRGIRDPRVLEALRTVPRHLFVPPGQQPLAYADRALPIDERQTISQPYIVAAMTELLAPGPRARVLEIGTGSGYQTAILSLLAAEVISVERWPSLAGAAEELLASLGYRNVRIITADGTRGFEAASPYDGILVTAGAPVVPAALKAQLAAGGRLVIPVGPERHQELRVVTRTAEGFDEMVGDPCVFVPLVGEFGWPA